MLNNGVGELLDKGEFGLGTAAGHARPTNRIELTKQKEEEDEREDLQE